MSDEIRPADSSELAHVPSLNRSLVPIQVGNAIVYVEQFGEPAVIESDDRIRPVAPLSPQNIFENAGEILRECIRVMGEKIESLAATARPQQITVEFSLTFEVKGKASVIPVLVTGEAAAHTGLKVTALWRHLTAGEH